MFNRYLIFFLVLWCLITSSSAFAQTWKPVEGPFGGKVSVFASAAEGDVFCSIRNRIFRTTDQGELWHEYFIDEYISQDVTAMACFDNVWLIGAGEILYRSTDKGKYWESIDSLGFDNFRQLVQLSRDSLLAGTDRELRISTDAGITWEKVESWKLSAAEIFKTDKRIFINTFSGLFESEDRLVSWHQTLRGDGSAITGRITGNGNSIFAYRTDISKVFYTTNGGDLWLFGAVMTPDSMLGNPFVSSKGIHYSLIRNQRIWKSESNGFIWLRADTGIIPYQNSVIFHETSDGTLLLSDGIRIFNSTNEGSKWTYSSQGLNCLNINSIHFTDEHIIIGTNMNGFFRAELTGNNWINIGFSLDELDVISLFSNKEDVILAGTHQKGCYKSTDGGYTFVPNNNGILEHNKYPHVFCINQTSSGRYLAGSSGLYGSDFYGWERLDNEILNKSDINDIRFDDYDDVYLASDIGIIHSKNYENWDIIGLHDKHILALHIDQNQIYAGSWSKDGFYFSNDLGNTWEVRNNGLPEFTMTKDIVSDARGVIYLATLNRGIFYTFDKGLTWHELNTDLPTGDMGAIAVSPNGQIFAGTRGWGLYVLDGVVDVQINYELKSDALTITPNPATDYIEINLINVMSAQAGIHNLSVKVFDVLGVEVVKATTPSLRDTPPCQGGESIKIDVSQLSPGVYFVRVDAQVQSFIKY